MSADVQQLGQDAAKLAAAPLWPLSDDELTGMLQAAHRLEVAAAVLQARLVRQADSRGLPATDGHRSTTGWLRSLLCIDPQPARDITEAAAAMKRHPDIEQAVLDNVLDLRQAVVIGATAEALAAELLSADSLSADSLSADSLGADSLGADSLAADSLAADSLAADSLSADSLSAGPPSAGGLSAEFAGCDRVPPADAAEIARQAQSTMIDMAGRLPAYQLRRVGERILAHVAPQLADRVDEAALARQEARAHARRGLTLSLPVDGQVRLSGVLGAEEAATVHAALHPLCTPTPGDDRTAAQRRADALVDVCALALRTGELPEDGGEPPQLAVTVAYDPLARTLGAAGTDTGLRLPAATARRLACDARILPVVLGGSGQILDAGRTRRLATGPLRRALHIRDRGCAFPDCDRPPRWTDAHHITAWTAGGTTTLDNHRSH